MTMEKAYFTKTLKTIAAASVGTLLWTIWLFRTGTPAFPSSPDTDEKWVSPFTARAVLKSLREANQTE